jgi:8-hydroxy-5-deazaflavin:NADPH oxidoreductase
MKVAIIGTGNVGRALGGSLAKAGHEVTFAGRDTLKAEGVANELGTTAAPTSAEAARGADVIILAVPGVEVDAVAADLAQAAAGKVVLDATNPLKPDYSGLANAGGPSNAERVAELLPGAHVAKAFNTVFGAVQADPTTHGTTLDALYATDDSVAAATVSQLASSIGFRPVHVGPLAASRELEAIAWLNIRLQMIDGGDWRTAVVLVGAPAASLGA